MSVSNLWARLLQTRLRPNKSRQTPAKNSRRRLFFALCPEEESTRQELAAAQGLLPRPLSDNWTRPANLHITLALRGGVEARWLDDLKEAADAVRTADFELSLDHMAYWPQQRILCLTPSVVPAALARLAADLAGNLEDAGFDRERRPYRPYLTLAHRSAYPPPDTRLALPILWKATSFALVESRPDGLGVAHKVVEAWPLRRPPGKPE